MGKKKKDSKVKRRIPLHILNRLTRARTAFEKDWYWVHAIDREPTQKERQELIEKELDSVLRWAGSAWYERRKKK